MLVDPTPSQNSRDATSATPAELLERAGGQDRATKEPPERDVPHEEEKEREATSGTPYETKRNLNIFHFYCFYFLRLAFMRPDSEPDAFFKEGILPDGLKSRASAKAISSEPARFLFALASSSSTFVHTPVHPAMQFIESCSSIVTVSTAAHTSRRQISVAE